MAADTRGAIERAASSEGEFSTFTFSLPRTFAGQTLELRGWLRTEAVTGWAGLWLREDGPNGSVQFDNMQRRNLRGTTEWTEYRITLPLDDAARTNCVRAACWSWERATQAPRLRSS